MAMGIHHPNQFPESITADKLQPAIVIGIGEIGGRICDEYQARQNVLGTFQPQLVEPYSTLIRTLKLPISALSVTSAVEIRTAFLSDQLVNTAHQIEIEFQAACAHIHQPGAILVEPTIVVLGATWEPVGAALLWPVAEVIRDILGEEINYHLVGVFLSANFLQPTEQNNHQQIGDAHTFSFLLEGDSLLANSPLDWQTQIRSALPGYNYQSGYLYDRLFLIDSLKANNSAVQANNNDNEIIVHVASVLEGLILTKTLRTLDNILLDDYRLADKQLYQSVGSSSIQIPLSELLDIVESFVTGQLLREHFFPDTHKENVFQLDSTRQFTAYQFAIRSQGIQLLKSWLAQYSEDGVPVDAEQSLFYDVKLKSLRDSYPPCVERVLIRGSNPTRSEKGLNASAVCDRLRQEVNTRENVREGIEEQVAVIYQEITDKFQDTCEETAGKFLKQGDEGLAYCVEWLSSLVNSFKKHSQELEQQASQIEASPLYERLFDQIEGEKRWRFEKYLRSIIKLVPRLSAILVRSGLLLVILYQFYFDGKLMGIDFWPYGPMNLGGNWEQFYQLLPLLFVSFLALFLAGVPILALQGAIMYHRGTLATLLKTELNMMFLRNTGQICKDIAISLEDKLEIFSKVLDEIGLGADKFLERAKDTFVEDNYLIHPVVQDLQELANVCEHETITQVRSIYGKRLLNSWLVDKPYSNWDIRLATEVIDSIRSKVTPEVHHIAMRPIGSFMDQSDYSYWLQALQRSSVPWFKISKETVETIPPLETGMLVLNDDQLSAFMQKAQQELSDCQIIEWNNPFRILFLRFLCGITNMQFVRYGQLQQAFQLQTEEQQNSITSNKDVLKKFSSLIKNAKTDDDQDAEQITSNVHSIQTGIAIGLSDVLRMIKDVAQHLSQGDKKGVINSLKPLNEYVIELNEKDLDIKEMVDRLNQLDDSRCLMNSRALHQLKQPLKKLDEFIADLEIELIQPQPGDVFDPSCHRAINIDSDIAVPEGKILKLHRRGYFDRNRRIIITPALVTVNSQSVKTNTV